MLLVACGLLAEGRIARGGRANPAARIVAGGGDAARLDSELRRAAPFAQGILSFGVAGGLAPGLRAGDVRVATAVLAPDGARFPSDPAWAARLTARLGTPPPVTFACVAQPLRETAAKAALHERTSAELVDMESSIAAEVAAAYDLPFAALRAVTDAAGSRLPPALAVSMRSGGRLDLPAILRSVAKQPAQVPALVRAGRDGRVALAALLRCRHLLGPDFALLDLG